ncbi:MAG: hypothetical protein FJW34_24500 [Acidobacteria bacterium]|nr:hypothetical protein [Acidobacteriota bacterium]
MLSSFREFKAGPDPRGRTWEVQFLWLQTGISIRHSDTVDVKFLLSDGEERLEKVIALPHPELLALSAKTRRPLTDPWCARLAARHLQRMVETGQDMEKTLVTCTPAELAACAADVA